MAILNAKAEICLFIDTGILIGCDTLNEFYVMVSKTHAAVLGYVYGFSNDNDKIIESLIDVTDIDISIKNMETNKFLDRREVGYSALGDNLMMWPANLSPGFPAFHFEGIYYLTNGNPFNFSKIIYHFNHSQYFLQSNS